MSDATAVPGGAVPGTGTAGTPANPANPAGEVQDEWKPEPRQWTWKDLFTAPMLAFKPKCMLVSAITVIVIGLWFHLKQDAVDAIGDHPFITRVLGWAWNTAALVIFSLAATLVAVFMKADLLDDEFLSLKEALVQYKGRLMPAILVPLFLMGLYGGFQVLIFLPELVASIPYAGPSLYALLYPLGFLLGLFVSLLTIAIFLSVFVFPSIVAIRKHGWFDNVVDTFEAVGTKPHVLVGSLFLVSLLIVVSHWIGFGGMEQLKASADVMPSDALKQTEMRATEVRESVLRYARVGPFGIIHNYFDQVATTFRPTASAEPMDEKAFDREIKRAMDLAATQDRNPGPAKGGIESYNKITGTVTGLWQVLIGALILGYCMNLFVGGGMLTYLVVREDDYWDDEDLEDLDQLAKELEEEAKQDAAKAGATAPAPAPAAPPATPSAPPGASTAATPPAKGGAPAAPANPPPAPPAAT